MNQGKQLKSLDQKEHICKVCETPFKASGAAKYCSNACKQKAKHQRAKDGVAARPNARIRKIRMTPEDVVAISSLLNFIQKLKKKEFKVKVIVEQEECLFSQYIDSLTYINADLQSNQ